MKFAPFIAVTIAIGAAVGWLAPGAPETAAEEIKFFFTADEIVG